MLLAGPQSRQKQALHNERARGEAIRGRAATARTHYRPRIGDSVVPVEVRILLRQSRA